MAKTKKKVRGSTTRRPPACEECSWGSAAGCMSKDATGKEQWPRATRNCSGYRNPLKKQKAILIMRKPNKVEAHVVDYDLTTKQCLASRPLDHVLRHSPDGFEYGYSGSGPADLALSICTEIWGRDKAEHIYQAFKEKFIATMNQNVKRHLLTGKAIVEWVKDIQPQIHQQLSAKLSDSDY